MGNQLLKGNILVNQPYIPQPATPIQSNQVSQLEQLSSAARQILQKEYPNIFQSNALNAQGYKIYQKCCYKGQLDQQNKPTGKGKLFIKGGTVMVADFVNQKANGQGLVVFSDGSHYKGQIKDNKAQGWGVLISGPLKYEGNFNENMLSGKGKLQIFDQSQTKFQGQFRNNTFLKGKLIWSQVSDGDNKPYQYQGEFNKQGQFHGEGSLINPKGRYLGWFENGKKNGGKFCYDNGLMYIGGYLNDQRHGQGTLYSSSMAKEQINHVEKDQFIAYKGQFLHNMPHGAGTILNSLTGNFEPVQYDDGVCQSLVSNINLSKSQFI